MKFEIVILLGIVSAVIGNVCKTVITPGGSNGGETCVFPFKFNGQTYNQCTPDSDPNGRYWCSLLTDGDGNHVARRRQWGYCNGDLCDIGQTDSECVTIGGKVEGKPCVFPFTNRGRTFNHCTLDFADDNFPWCSTAVDANGNHINGQWGHCDCDKPCCDSSPHVESTTPPSPRTPRPPVTTDKQPLVTDKNSGLYLPGFDDCSLENRLSFETPLPPDVFAVVGGDDTLLFSVPYAVLIGSKEKNKPDDPVRYRCGASLINKKYALTAAHCFLKKSLEYVQVVLGEYDLSTDPDCSNFEGCAEKAQKIPIEEIVIHEEYAGTGNHLNDIALIRLARPAFYNKAVAPVCLPLDTQMTEAILKVPDLHAGLNTRVAYGMGWGRVEAFSNGEFKDIGAPSPVLQWARLNFVNHSTCKEKLTRLFGRKSGNIIDEFQICAGHDYRDTCSGDSGGPLMAPGIGANRGESIIQIGIVSYGSTFCGDGNPAVYTRVSSYLDWIQNHLKP